jgi:disulfide bond formation protein DsbB
MTAPDALTRRWPPIAFLASAAMLAIAHGFQTFGHLAPCHLCLQQRQVYWAALVPAGLGTVVLFTPFSGPGRRIAGAVLALIFAYGAYLAGFHAGAEWKWWPAPETCASTGAHVTLKDLAALMGGASAPPPPCDQAAWRLFGLSMAGYNFLVSLGLTGLSAFSALRGGRG